MRCSKCGNEFEGKFCPNCGAPAEEVNMDKTFTNNETTKKDTKEKAKKPFYKKWWFILIIVVLIIAIISSISGGSDDGEKFSWDDMILGEMIPEPSSSRGNIIINDDEELYIRIYKTSESDYSDYVEACEDMGYTVDAEKSNRDYNAYNADGYKLSLLYSSSSEEMTIDLNIPIELSEITWLTTKLGQLIPVPKSLMGNFSYENEDSFYVTIGETSEEDFNEYITAVSDVGFNVDYNKGDDYYYADNSEGYHVSISYEGFNLMTIRADAPDDVDDEEEEIPEEDVDDVDDTDDADVESTDDVSTDDSSDANTDSSDDDLVDGMHQDFKDAMDSYEAFIDEYIVFMEKYSNSDGSDATLLADYATYMTRYADLMAKFEAWESEDLNDAEYAYYIEVQTRVNQKLLDASIS